MEDEVGSRKSSTRSKLLPGNTWSRRDRRANGEGTVL